MFVLGLLLIIRGRTALLKTITAFTVAHSLTLAAVTLGYASAPFPSLNAAIALSILFVARELAAGDDGGVTLARRRPWLMAFGFGLVHGLGFAGALREIGLPHEAVPAALAFFNFGVEAGQVLFVGVVLGAAALLSRLPVPRGAALGGVAGHRIGGIATYGIGGVAAFWLIERVARL